MILQNTIRNKGGSHMKTLSSGTAVPEQAHIVDLGTPLKKLKKGAFFRLKSPSTGAVLIKGDYDRSLKKYECQYFDDVNRWVYLKATKLVYTDFVF